MKHALIHGTRVCQVVGARETFEVAPPLFWVDAPDDVTDRHTYDGRAFSAPVEVVKSYRDLRVSEYPSAGDVIDAMLKAQDGSPSDLVAVKAARAAVKAKYPKPA